MSSEDMPTIFISLTFFFNLFYAGARADIGSRLESRGQVASRVSNRPGTQVRLEVDEVGICKLNFSKYFKKITSKMFNTSNIYKPDYTILWILFSILINNLIIFLFRLSFYWRRKWRRVTMKSESSSSQMTQTVVGLSAVMHLLEFSSTLLEDLSAQNTSTTY